jgi:hypothetical protein
MLNLIMALAACTGAGPLGWPDDSTIGDDSVGEFSATLRLRVPDDVDVTGAVGVVDGATAACDIETRECVWTLDERQDVEVTVECPTHLFVPKSVSAAELKDGEELTLEWALGGCGDESWTPDQGEQCDSWTPGEYGLAPNGMYYVEDDSAHRYEVSTSIYDLDGDGKEEIILEGVTLAYEVATTLSGGIFSGYDPRNFEAAGTIENDLGKVYTTFTIPGGQVFVKTLVKSE